VTAAVVPQPEHQTQRERDLDYYRCLESEVQSLMDAWGHTMFRQQQLDYARAQIKHLEGQASQ
jgi:hypothetical protein